MKILNMNETELNVEGIIEQRAMYNNVSPVYPAGKRIFDLAVSVLAVILLLPLFLLVGLLIKMDSSGTVFFKQKRNGFKGKPFNMYKFRSMVPDAEQRFEEIESRNEVSGCMFKIRRDPRVTRVGRILRKTSIDELPQLFNVIRGEMSIVGPRPPLLREVQKYDSWHKLRMSVKPGITGLWQVSGRNEIGFEDMCRLDLKYIRERGFIYDLTIILKTVYVLFDYTRAY